MKHFRARAGMALIRQFRQKDESSLARNASYQQISCNLRNSFPFPYTLKDARDWIALATSQKPVHNFAIAHPANIVIGGIGLSPGQDIHSRSTELGYWITPDFWNRGIATAAVKAITEYALCDLEYIRVSAMVFSKNWASRAVLEKNGFILEGIQRKHATKNNKIKDMALYSRLDSDIREGEIKP